MYSAAVITVSDKGSRGQREDTGGPLVCALLKETGFDVNYTAIVPDEMDAIEGELIYAADTLDSALIVTTGGTGFSPAM
jgi:molybdenum cofactor synthesis domain-containing protein